MNDNMVKIIFELQQDEDGWPPCGSESLWATKIPDGLYRLANIPFFARDVAWMDIVQAEQVDHELIFKEVIESSGHSTIRVILKDLAKKDDICQRLRTLGCNFEQSHIPSLLAIDIPPGILLSRIKSYLEEMEQHQLLEYEEGCIAKDQ